MSKKIKNSHVLIICPGYSIKTHYDKIKQFIKDKDVVTIGCSYITNFFIPDYHFWADKRRYRQYGKDISKKSKMIFGQYLDKKLIRRHWKGTYEIMKYTKRKWKKSYESPDSFKYGMGEAKYDSKTKIFSGVLRTTGSLAIFWVYIKQASKISIVGMDGYTLYSKDSLQKKEKSQHCLGKGFTATRNNAHGTSNIDKFYKFCKKEDEDVYKILNYMKRYGVKFEIITDTVYKDFHNPIIS